MYGAKESQDTRVVDAGAPSSTKEDAHAKLKQRLAEKEAARHGVATEEALLERDRRREEERKRREKK